MFKKEQLKKILVKAKVIDEKSFNKFKKEEESQGKKLEPFLLEKKILSESSLYETVAKFFKLPFINLKKEL